MTRVFRRFRIFLAEFCNPQLREIRKAFKQLGTNKLTQHLILNAFMGRRDEVLSYLKGKLDAKRRAGIE